MRIAARLRLLRMGVRRNLNVLPTDMWGVVRFLLRGGVATWGGKFSACSGARGDVRV